MSTQVEQTRQEAMPEILDKKLLEQKAVKLLALLETKFPNDVDFQDINFRGLAHLKTEQLQELLARIDEVIPYSSVGKSDEELALLFSTTHFNVGESLRRIVELLYPLENEFGVKRLDKRLTPLLNILQKNPLFAKYSQSLELDNSAYYSFVDTTDLDSDDSSIHEKITVELRDKLDFLFDRFQSISTDLRNLKSVNDIAKQTIDLLLSRFSGDDVKAAEVVFGLQLAIAMTERMIEVVMLIHTLSGKQRSYRGQAFFKLIGLDYLSIAGAKADIFQRYTDEMLNSLGKVSVEPQEEQEAYLQALETPLLSRLRKEYVALNKSVKEAFIAAQRLEEGATNVA